MRKFFIIILLVFLTTSLSASYVPKFESNFGLMIFKNSLDKSNRVALQQEISFTPVSFNLKDNIINLGIGFENIGESNIISETIVPTSLSTILYLGYERMLNKNISLALDLGAGISVVTATNTIYPLVNGTLSCYYYFVEYLALGGKINFTYSKFAMGGKASLAMTYRFDGVML